MMAMGLYINADGEVNSGAVKALLLEWDGVPDEGYTEGEEQVLVGLGVASQPFIQAITDPSYTMSILMEAGELISPESAMTIMASIMRCAYNLGRCSNE
jgi:hypothetical protein